MGRERGQKELDREGEIRGDGERERQTDRDRY